MGNSVISKWFRENFLKSSAWEYKKIKKMKNIIYLYVVKSFKYEMYYFTCKISIIYIEYVLLDIQLEKNVQKFALSYYFLAKVWPFL